MIQILQTQHPEQAALLLAKHYRHVVICGKHHLSTTIRINRKTLGKECFIARNGDRAQVILGLWREQGGLLLNYVAGPLLIPHEAQAFSECPLSLAKLHEETPATIACAAIYRPPSWTHHEFEIERIAPSADVCQRVLSAISAAGITSADRATLNALGMPSGGVVAITDDALSEKTGITPRHLPSVIRALVYGNRWECFAWVLPIVPRIEPPTPGLMALYRHIEKLPSLNGVRLSQDAGLSKVARNAKVQLRALERCGSISLRPRIGFYVPENIRLKEKGLAQIHAAARAALRQIIQTVESAPELNQWSLSRLQRGQPRLSVARAPREGAGLSPDIPD